MSTPAITIRTPRTQQVPRFTLESGEVLADVVQAYHLDGTINPARDNVVLVFHALTGSADASGDWWREVIGPGRAIDTTRYGVLCANLLGSCYGTTGPGAADEPTAFPRITPRDMARLTALLVAELGISSLAMIAGGSLGGMVAMEYALADPLRARSLVALAAPAAHTAWAIAWNAIQRRALDLGGDDGLALARMIGMMTYRTESEFGARFGRETRDDEFAAATYLAYQGDKLVRRFNAASYRVLTEAMDAHDIGRGRGGMSPALRALRAAVNGPVVGVGVTGDNLYSADEIRRWTDGAGAPYRELRSTLGHDAFLLESEQVGRVLADTLRDVEGLALAEARLREMAS
ncbi:MAG: homoserine O-acetyltransferase [Gemmatimonadota bacterium]|nr:homoserine O-acetyltransferase [Gemmatimonadota bacterium]